MFLETDLDNWESFCLSPHSSTPEVAIKNWKTLFCSKITNEAWEKKLGKKFQIKGDRLVSV